MADEEDRNSPRSTSEATPPHVDDSPEMVSQPSPPEEQRVSSSTDGQPPEVADSPDGQRVSSTSDLEPNDGAASSSRLTVAELLLLETNEARAVEGGSPPSLPTQSSVAAAAPETDDPQDLSQRISISFPPGSFPIDEPVESVVEGAVIQAGLVRASLGSPFLGRAMKAAQEKRAETDSNQEFDVDDSSTGSKSSENVDLDSDSSPTGPGVVPEDSGSNVTETAGLGSHPSPRIGAAIEEKSSSGIGATETVGLESESSPPLTSLIILVVGRGATENIGLRNESSPSKTDSTASVSGSGTTENVGLRSESSPSQTGRVILVVGRGATENIGLRNESSPTKRDSSVSVSGSGTTENVGLRSELPTSKTDTSSVEESGSTSGTPERKRQSFSPKRKSPTKCLHLSPKRSAPFHSPDKLQRQSDSQMSTLLEELDIKAQNEPESSEPVSTHEQEMSAQMGETVESPNEEADMEVQETDSRTEQGEMEESD